MMVALLVWFGQDLLQVLFMGFLLVPGFFLLLMLFRTAAGIARSQNITWCVWQGFIGGVIWDFRWTGLPGLSAVLNTLAIAFMAWIWWRSPATGRTPLFFAITAGGAHFLVGFVHYLTWDISSSTALRLFSIQQLLMLPFLILLYIFYAWKVSDTHV